MASRFPLPAPSASRPRALVSSAILRRFILPAARACRLSSAAAQPRARRTYACWWQDAIGREIAAADYGTNGGAALVRPEVPPASSETVLVTRTVHASTGEPGSVIDPMGTVTRWKRDAIGREIETIENFREGAAPAADVNRTTRFGYHPSGGLETLTPNPLRPRAFGGKGAEGMKKEIPSSNLPSICQRDSRESGETCATGRD